MVRTIEARVSEELGEKYTSGDLASALDAVHGSDPIARTDSLSRLAKAQFRVYLRQALYPGTADDPFVPSATHWHIASLGSPSLMADLFTSNYDDLLEDAKQALDRGGRVRHFHGKLPQRWNGKTVLSNPPVVTSRDYMAAEERQRYVRLAAALRNKTVLLVGFSLYDPNLTRIIRNEASDCRALIVASPKETGNPRQQVLRIELLRRFWNGLNVAVTAIEAYEELPAFFLAMRTEIARLDNRPLARIGSRALNASVKVKSGGQEWSARVAAAVT